MPVTKRDGLARRWGRVFSGVEHVIGDASRKRWAGMRCSAGSGGRAVEASERGRPRGRSGRGSKHGNGPPASHPRPPFRCGPLGGDLAQALLFSRTAYDCSPQCLLPASPLEVKDPVGLPLHSHPQEEHLRSRAKMRCCVMPLWSSDALMMELLLLPSSSPI
ncbi:uncharacterized protein LOC129534903 isoform X3 [Moschus berezovskii]|uniref:uncharacterized protein LOC129534903 isoform X3 n=1 Tax=Moschus berezovskii TaxID=68408 RepID=UPI0024442EEE|nr:uncharacterized protein LOC129534903 isoform X3 [Moschus berezovskii]